MTRYAMNEALWRYAREPDFRARFDENPGQAISESNLSEAESAALEKKDIRSIFALGAHPFLIYSFAIAANGGWSFEFMTDYVGRLEGLELGDIET